MPDSKIDMLHLPVVVLKPKFAYFEIRRSLKIIEEPILRFVIKLADEITSLF